MRYFQIGLIKCGRSGNDIEGYSLEPDDFAEVWVKEKSFRGFNGVVKYLKRYYPNLPFTGIDEIDKYNKRCYIDTSASIYDNSEGLSCESVGMAWFSVSEFKYEDNDPEYGDKLFFYDGTWNKY